MLITVFTPTYNRAHLLPRLYESLCKQSNSSFEWLIVDDGSTDNTEGIVTNWAKEQKIALRYYKQENGGKHRAINRGVSLAKGEAFFIVDSDDWLDINAIDVIQEMFESISKDLGSEYSGVCGLRVYPDGKLIGSSFSGNYIDTNTYLRKENGISGDKSEIFFTDVIQRFPFPDIEGEKFCPEDLVWNRISDAGYVMRYFNKGIYFCEYQPDGLTSKIDSLLTSSYKGYMLYAKELRQSKYSSQKDKVKCLSNAVRRARINHWSFNDIAEYFNCSVITVILAGIVAKITYSIRRKRA